MNLLYANQDVLDYSRGLILTEHRLRHLQLTAALIKLEFLKRLRLDLFTV